MSGDSNAIQQQTPGQAVKIKRAVRQRDGFRCTSCGITNAAYIAKCGRNLDVHRVVPGSRYSIEPGVCITTCRACHSRLPKRKKGEIDQVNKPLLFMRISEKVHQALQAFIATQRVPPERTTVGIQALTEFLEREGHWPPPKSA